MPLSHSRWRRRLRSTKTMPATSQIRPKTMPPPRWPRWAWPAGRVLPPSMVHRPDSHWRSGESNAVQRGLGGNGEDQPGEQGAQVAVGGQDEHARRTAARQDHADAEQQAADDGAGDAAGGRPAGGPARHPARPPLINSWVTMTAVEKAKQPDSQLGRAVPVPEFDHGRAQAEAGALGKSTEQQSDDQAGEGDAGLFAEKFDQAVQVHNFCLKNAVDRNSSRLPRTARYRHRHHSDCSLQGRWISRHRS
jgi:hypothetical protein